MIWKFIRYATRIGITIPAGLSGLKRFFSLILISTLIQNCLILEIFSDRPGKKKNKEIIVLLFLAGMDEDPGEEFSGGDTTTFDSTRDAFNIAGSNILAERRIDFFEPGNSVFDSTWVEAPASTSGIDGLGPVFNQRACVSCHQRDGRGRPPTSSESQMLSMLIRLSVSGSDPVTGGPVGVTNYGGQLNDKGIASGGVSAEGSSTVSYTEIPGTFPDGEIYSLRRPAYNFTWNFGTPASFLFSPRTAPMIPGLGLLEAIRETTIKSFEDPNDRDGDGISGRMNLVYDFATGTMKTGRFGWKANQPNLRQQAQAAFLGDIGITSPLFIAQNCEPVQTSCLSATSGASYDTESGKTVEVTRKKIDQITFYTQTLGVPGRRNWKDGTVRAGKTLFSKIGCSKCHIPKIQTGTLDGVPEVSNQTIRPYTDLLLHDMGPDLADNRQDFVADGQEWRTPPLWGVGLIKTVNNHDNLLHDGRARGSTEAILWHGGEGEASRNSFRNLAKSDRDALLKFLESL